MNSLAKGIIKHMRTGYLTIGTLLLALWASVIVSTIAVADDYADARGALIRAYQQGDYATMRAAADAALRARPGYPAALFNRALAEVLDDDPASSMRTLRELLSINVDFGVADTDAFAPLRALDDWEDYVSSVRRLKEPTGVAEIVVTVAEAEFIPEGIARDAEGRIYLGSIRKGRIIRIDDGPETLSTPAQGHWSVFGMRFDADGGLWFASASVPQFERHKENGNETGLFRLDVTRGEISDRALLPKSASPQLLGDLVIADNGDIYATDSLSGAVYRFRPVSPAYETLVKPGVFGSPQGLALDESGQYLYVADYTGGLSRISLRNGDVDKVIMATGATDVGIDGLYRYGNQLIGIQNGIQPHRVAAFTLGEDGLSITGARILAANLPEFDEPTLGLVDDDHFYFVANSHWNRFDAEENLPEGLTGPIVLKLPLFGPTD